MAYICSHPESYVGQIVGNGQCAIFVEKAAGVPNHMFWGCGVPVRGSSLAKGTAIATFVNGKYLNLPHGNHAAIYMRQDSNAIYVLDQWVRRGDFHPVSERPIRFKNGAGSAVDDGDAYSVIE